MAFTMTPTTRALADVSWRRACIAESRVVSPALMMSTTPSTRFPRTAGSVTADVGGESRMMRS